METVEIKDLILENSNIRNKLLQTQTEIETMRHSITEKDKVIESLNTKLLLATTNDAHYWKQQYYNTKDKLNVLKDCILELSLITQPLKVLDKTIDIMFKLFRVDCVTVYHNYDLVTCDISDSVNSDTYFTDVIYRNANSADNDKYKSIALSKQQELLNKLDMYKTVGYVPLTTVEIKDLNEHETCSGLLGKITNQKDTIHALILIESRDYNLAEADNQSFFGALIDIASTSYINTMVGIHLGKMYLTTQRNSVECPKTHLLNDRALQKDGEGYSNKNMLYVYADLDHFKRVNDNYGHAVGDDVLIYFANMLKEVAKLINGKAYRPGGEEFIIIAECALDRALPILESLRESLKQKIFNTDKGNFNISVSIGAYYSDNESYYDDCIKRADELVYQSKENGRDRITVKDMTKC